MALYGHELTEEINPLEAALSWAVAFDKGDFIGRDALLGGQGSGRPGAATRRLPDGWARHPARGLSRSRSDGETVGYVTSGGYAPTLDAEHRPRPRRRDVAGIGKPLDIIIRNQPVAAEQVRTPFYRRPEATEKGNA